MVDEKRLKKRKKLKKKAKLKKRVLFQRKVASSVAKRHNAEKRLKAYGIAAILVSFIFLFILLFNVFSKGTNAFVQTRILIPVSFEESLVLGRGETFEQKVQNGKFQRIIRNGLKGLFPDAKSRSERRDLYQIISKHASAPLKDMIIENRSLLNKTENIWLVASSDVDVFLKHPEKEAGRASDNQKKWLELLEDQGRIKKTFNTTFFTAGDSREPESAGILGGFIGSVLVVLSCMILAFPLGVMTAIYLEEFAPKNKVTNIIEVNINNLAAVPSIIFGLLGLAVYIQMVGIPRSAALAGGLTLAMMAVPVIVIATRTSLRSIPQSIRDAAIALGASRVQTTFHHVLPLAMPGIMTGAILSIARVMGETAPLIMIGMVAFIVDIPDGLLVPSSALPVQVYLWADSPETGFVEKTSAAIIILLMLLAFFNIIAAYIRKRFEIRW